MARSKKRRSKAQSRTKSKKRHSPESQKNPNESSTYDKVARTTINIRANLVRRRSARLQQLRMNSDDSDSPYSLPPEAKTTWAQRKKIKNVFKTPEITISPEVMETVATTISPEVISLLSSADSTGAAKRSHEEEPVDAGLATPIPTATTVSTSRCHACDLELGSDTEGSISDGSVSTLLFPFWSVEALEKAPATIARVGELISHLMVVGLRNSKKPLPPKHTLTDVQRTRMILHDN